MEAVETGALFIGYIEFLSDNPLFVELVEEALSDLMLISNYNYVIDKNVSYPIADDEKT